MADNELLFDGSGRTDVEYYIFYSENVAEVNTKGNQQKRAVIRYILGRAFQFYYHSFTIQGELTDEAKDYKLVKQNLKREFGTEKDLQVAIEVVILLKTSLGESLSAFLENADAVYREVKNTDAQNILFISKAALITDNV